MKLGKLCKKLLYPDTHIIIESNNMHTDLVKVSDFLEMVKNHIARKEIFRIKVKKLCPAKAYEYKEKSFTCICDYLNIEVKASADFIRYISESCVPPKAPEPPRKFRA